MKIIYIILTALFMGITLDMSAQNYLGQFAKSSAYSKFTSGKIRNLENGHQAAMPIKIHKPFAALTELGEGFWIDEDVFQTYPMRAKGSLIIGKAYKYQRATFVAQLNDFQYLFAELSDMVGK
jgi:hypothetical protein